jgi:nitrite reductase/ring-hydroxylating ferredoxin subunit
MVLARGLLGDQDGTPKVACPLHKKTFNLETGECMSGDDLSVHTFPVKIEGDFVYLELPAEKELGDLLTAHDCGSGCSAHAAE